MQWFRANIRHGAVLALVALLIQAVLSFGHSHASVDASNVIASFGQRGPATHDRAHNGTTTPDQDRHHHDGCAICAVAAMTATAISPSPPWLLLPPPPAPLPQDVAWCVAAVHTAQAFQPRAPPSLG